MLITYLFVSILILEWVFMFFVAFFFRFKENYKDYYQKLFEQKRIVRPYGWDISRLRNHRRYEIFKWLTFAALILSLGYGTSALDDLFLLVILTLAIPLIIIMPLGTTVGRLSCKNAVKRECEKFSIPFVGI